ncbi:MAG: antitoxin HigA-1 [Alphaproteobacteria bacterium]|nr:antitoxin HigA-1 [Alphaproteobacteria bacterium]
MLMKNPPHPGRIIRQECIEALGLTVTAAAPGLGIARKTLSEILNGRSGISPEMALRLARAFGSGPEIWLGLQMDYDLAQAQKKAGKIKVRDLRCAA